MLFDTEYMLEGAPPPTAAEEVLSSQLETAWVNFARTGDPNAPTPLPTQPGHPAFTMPKFEAARPSSAIANFSLPSSAVAGFRGDKCPYFDGIGYNRG